MFPVVSLLRRTAAAFIYVTPDHLEVQDGSYWLRLQSPASSVNLTKGNWNPATDLAPLYMMVARGSSSADAAIALTKKENELYEKVQAQDLIFTMVLGLEDEVEVEGGIERRARYALVRGVFRAAAPRLKQASIAAPRVVTFGAVPKKRAPPRGRR